MEIIPVEEVKQVLNIALVQGRPDPGIRRNDTDRASPDTESPADQEHPTPFQKQDSPKPFVLSIGRRCRGNFEAQGLLIWFDRCGLSKNSLRPAIFSDLKILDGSTGCQSQ